MAKVFHFISKLLHTIDKTMEKKAPHRWTDHVNQTQHLANQPYKIQSSNKEK
jgi:hypothetical protein